VVPAAEALAKAADLLLSGGVAIVGSGRSSVEEQFLTRKLANAIEAPVWLVGRVGEGDGMLISADRNPNVRGALVTGLIKTLPEIRNAALSSRSVSGGNGAVVPDRVRVGGLGDLAAQIDAGRVKTVISEGEDLAAAGLSEAQLGKIAIVLLGTHASATSTAAQVVIPTLTVFEKSGTFINQQFRLQKFAAAVPGPQGVDDDLVTLARLLQAVRGPALPGDINGLWRALAADVKQLAAASYRCVPDTGLLLDGSDFADLPFPEGETLHFKPLPKRVARSEE
jgi:NADH-quinone oxidoreductase subunit G